MSYLLDGKPVDFQQLIDAARDEGYESDDGLFLTSEAAAILRGNGHTVKDAKC